MTSVGVMAAMELGVPKDKFAKAMDYLQENAKTFEEVRIAAAAVEAWGVKDCPFELNGWLKIGLDFHASLVGGEVGNGYSRDFGSYLAMLLRLDASVKVENGGLLLTAGQRKDGGWNKKGAKSSDIESTYRVMRALMLLKEKPKDVKKLREFIAAHRNKDGGCATTPGEPSNMSGVYYCTIITKWLDDLEK
jgi:hypothetical protein